MNYIFYSLAVIAGIIIGRIPAWNGIKVAWLQLIVSVVVGVGTVGSFVSLVKQRNHEEELKKFRVSIIRESILDIYHAAFFIFSNDVAPLDDGYAHFNKATRRLRDDIERFKFSANPDDFINSADKAYKNGHTYNSRIFKEIVINSLDIDMKNLESALKKE